MSEAKVLNGNQVVGEAARQIDPDVIAAYPITPSTGVVETIAMHKADGRITGEFVCPESEHSAMSVCIGASAAGGRVMTATASQGLALMWEMLYIAAGLRLPIVAAIANRALSTPINIHGDHSDSMGARDSGWIQLYSENVQETYDNMLQAFRIAEHPEVRTPVMVCFDGFIISHAVERVSVEEDGAVRAFVGDYVPVHPLLDTDNVKTIGPLAFTDSYFEHKRSQIAGIEAAARVAAEVGAEFGRTFGRVYGFFEEYRMEDAELAVVVMSSAAGTGKDAIDEMRSEGLKIGLVKPRLYRPFPAERLVEALRRTRAVAVLDRASSPGAAGAPLFTELRSAFYGLAERPVISGSVFGLGGRDITTDHFREVGAALVRAAETGRADAVPGYLNLRE